MSPGFHHPGINRPGGSFGRHPHGPRFGGSLPLIIPYPVYTNYDAYGYEAYGAQAGQQPLQIEIRVVQDGKDQNQTDQYEPGDQIPGESDSEGESRLTMRNDRGQPRQESSKSAQPSESAQAAEPAPAREVVPTVLIFRDGHRQEVRNYAIMGKVLYDLEDSRKIQLAELDIPATVKENDERGVRFAMPRE
jgi:hypothetical protein